MDKYFGTYTKPESSNFFENSKNTNILISCDKAKRLAKNTMQNKHIPALVDYTLTKDAEIVAYVNLDCKTLQTQNQVDLNKGMIIEKSLLNGGTPKPRKGSYESMTVAQLKERCAKKGLKGYSSLRKAELIAALRK